MAQFGVNVRLYQDSRVKNLSCGALGMWLLLLGYSVENSTVWIAPAIPSMIGGAPRFMRELADAGLVITPSSEGRGWDLADNDLWSRAAKSPRRPIPPSVRFAVFARDNYQCRNCHSRESLTLDHIVPYSVGGSDDQTNLQTLCLTCNCRKGAS